MWRAPETTAQGGRSVLVHHPLALEPPLEGLRPLFLSPVAHMRLSILFVGILFIES
jgi:hypothetical protein